VHVVFYPSFGRIIPCVKLISDAFVELGTIGYTYANR
jgi:hypothetical protein